MELPLCEDYNFQRYSVKSKPRGYVLLINIETFENGFKHRRYGSEKDFEMLRDMWKNFGYSVKEYYNLNNKDLKNAISGFASMPEHRSVDSAIVFIMSHGKEDPRNPHGVMITATDDQYVSSDWIRDRFSSVNCPALINKPKIIFFQACRGSQRDRGTHVSCANMETGFTMIGNTMVPAMTDLLMVYPTLPGYVSQRDPSLGAWFVQECISVFTNDSPHLDLLSMLNKVDRLVQRKRFDVTDSYFQVVYYESWGFNKKMYFDTNKRKKCNSKYNKRYDSLERVTFPMIGNGQIYKM